MQVFQNSFAQIINDEPNKLWDFLITLKEMTIKE